MNENKIIFLNGQISYSVEIFKLPNIVILKFLGDIPTLSVLTSGFYIINEHNNKNMTGDEYYNYNTIYKQVGDDTFYLSNNNSVCVSDDNSVDIMTEDDYLRIFESYKLQKIEESKYLLNKYFEDNPLYSNCHNNTYAYYNVTSEKQLLMISNYLTYTIKKNLNLNSNISLTWNATKEECELWTEEEFLTLILQTREYVEPLVSLQQSYEVQIRNCTTQEELDAIVITYDIYSKE